MNEKTLIAIGRVTGVHGLAGNLKVWLHSDSFEAFKKGRHVLLKAEKEAGDTYRILKATPYKKGLLLVLEGVDNRDKAETLIQKDIYIPKDELPELEEDAFYWQDLLGMDVIDKTRGHIGTIDHIFPTGANDVLVVKKEEPEQIETLVPVISSVILSVDLPNHQIHIDLPEGL